MKIFTGLVVTIIIPPTNCKTSSKTTTKLITETFFANFAVPCSLSWLPSGRYQPRQLSWQVGEYIVLKLKVMIPMVYIFLSHSLFNAPEQIRSSK